MLEHEKFLEIIKGLIEKTRAGKANWELSAIPQSIHLRLPRSLIRLNYDSPRTDFDSIHIDLQGEDGRSVGGRTFVEGDPGWDLANELFSMVHQRLMGSDKVLEDIDRYLKSDAG